MPSWPGWAALGLGWTHSCHFRPDTRRWGAHTLNRRMRSRCSLSPRQPQEFAETTGVGSAGRSPEPAQGCRGLKGRRVGSRPLPCPPQALGAPGGRLRVRGHASSRAQLYIAKRELLKAGRRRGLPECFPLKLMLNRHALHAGCSQAEGGSPTWRGRCRASACARTHPPVPSSLCCGLCLPPGVCAEGP